jgi:predicted ATPase
MSRIRIKNFGPIKEGLLENDGWIDIKKVTMFIGNQGSGKSTVAKLISTFMWMEKALYRGDYPPSYFETYDRFKKNFLTFHRIENYFTAVVNGSNNTHIEFEGSRYKFTYNEGGLTITELAGAYELPQVIYIPDGRNFVSSINTFNRNSARPNSRTYSTTSPSLADFALTVRDATEAMAGDLELPIKGVYIEYQKLNGVLYLKGKDYKIRIEEAASGFQSLVPLYLVTWFLANSLKKDSGVTGVSMPDDLEKFRTGAEAILSNSSLTEEQKRIALSVLSTRFNKTALINIVEEPELSLFPTSQKEILYSLLEFNNMLPGNTLIMTTHSPYLINYFTVSIGAYNLLEKIRAAGKTDLLRKKVFEIIPKHHLVNPKDLVIYEMDEETGTIRLLGNYRGLPSDENKLNVELGLTNDEYSKLLEIEKLCR